MSNLRSANDLNTHSLALALSLLEAVRLPSCAPRWFKSRFGDQANHSVIGEGSVKPMDFAGGGSWRCQDLTGPGDLSADRVVKATSGHVRGVGAVEGRHCTDIL